jgi:hypothetical protein
LQNRWLSHEATGLRFAASMRDAALDAGRRRWS